MDLRDNETQHIIEIPLLVRLLKRDLLGNDTTNRWIVHSEFDFMLADNLADVEKDLILNSDLQVGDVLSFECITQKCHLEVTRASLQHFLHVL